MGTPKTANFRGTPTTVTFRGDKACRPTQKDAYIWLITRFFDAYPDLLEDKSITDGPVVNYFARSPRGLSPEIAQQDHYYEHIILLSSGKWYVNVKLDNPLKVNILSRMANRKGLVEGTDWSWHNDSPKQSTDAKRRKLREDSEDLARFV
jgi:hypothetical protein